MAFRLALARARTAGCSVCRLLAVVQASEAWAAGYLFVQSYDRQLASELFDAADHVWGDTSLSDWHRAVLRLSVLGLQAKLGLKDADERSRMRLAEHVITTLRDSCSFAPNPIDKLIVHWTCLFCIARPPRKKAPKRNQWANDAMKTADVLAAVNLVAHAEDLSRTLAVKVPQRAKLHSRFKHPDDPGRRALEVIDQIQTPRLLAPQMRAGISSLVHYLRASPGRMSIVKTPTGLLALREITVQRNR